LLPIVAGCKSFLTCEGIEFEAQFAANGLYICLTAIASATISLLERIYNPMVLVFIA
jgi:hypothetical protein